MPYSEVSVIDNRPRFRLQWHPSGPHHFTSTGDFALIRTLLASFVFVAMQAFAAADGCICPYVNMGPYGSGYLYYAIRYDDCAGGGCNTGVPTAFIGPNNAESYCASPADCSTCATLGGGSPAGAVASGTYFTNISLKKADYTSDMSAFFKSTPTQTYTLLRSEVVSVTKEEESTVTTKYAQLFLYHVESTIKTGKVEQKLSSLLCVGLEIAPPTKPVPCLHGGVRRPVYAKQAAIVSDPNIKPYVYAWADVGMAEFVEVDWGGTRALVRVNNPSEWPRVR